MNIGIIGPGAIGLLFYFFLSRKVKDLILLDKDKRRALLLRNKGLTVVKNSKSYKINVNITAQPQELEDRELFLICVKSYDTLEVAKTIKSISRKNKDYFVLSLQNGLGKLEVLSEILGEEKVLGGVTNMGSTLLSPGVIKFAGEGKTIIGSLKKKTVPVLREIRSVFNSCDIPTSITSDLEGAIWSKLLINIAINPLTSILRVKNGELLNNPHSSLLMQMVLNEAHRITKRKRIKLLYNDPQTKLEAVCRATSENISSMLQDILRGKKTEIDYLNGAIYKLGESLKIPTPLNFIFFKLVKSLEETSLKRVDSFQDEKL